MAGTNLGSLMGSGLLCLLLLAPKAAAAAQYRVGGPSGWGVPAPDAESFNRWAERHRFQKGDSLLLVYPPDKDSVLLVSKEDYDSCNTANPTAKFIDGTTVFTFDRSGPFFFISGVPENCNKNQKLVVVVLANHSAGAIPPTFPPPPPSPAPATPPAPATEAPPSPSPEGSAASPPPPPSIEIVPAPAPPQGGQATSPPPAPSAAPLKAVGTVGSAGALLGSLAFLVL